MYLYLCAVRLKGRTIVDSSGGNNNAHLSVES